MSVLKRARTKCLEREGFQNPPKTLLGDRMDTLSRLKWANPISPLIVEPVGKKKQKKKTDAPGW